MLCSLHSLLLTALCISLSELSSVFFKSCRITCFFFVPAWYSPFTGQWVMVVFPFHSPLGDGGIPLSESSG